MRLVPLNTQETLKLIPRFVRQGKSGVALRFPPHSTKPFLDCAGKAKRRRRFSHTRSPLKERNTAHLPRFYRCKTVSVGFPKTRSVVRIVVIHASHD
jgi:hypothetical protein